MAPSPPSPSFEIAESTHRRSWGLAAANKDPAYQAKLKQERLEKYGRERFSVRLKATTATEATKTTLPDTIEDILSIWDKGTKNNRRKLLQQMATSMQGISSLELERRFGSRASLLLSRIIAWLRLTYTIEASVANMLTVIYVFVIADTGARNLEHFTQSGGLQTCLEIVTHEQTTEVQRLWALKVLLISSHGGKIFKELICEQDGVVSIINACNKFKCDESFTVTKDLLISLGTSNPFHCALVHEEILAVFPKINVKTECKLIFVITLQQLIKNDLKEQRQTNPDARYVKAIVSLFNFNDQALQGATYQLLEDLVANHGLEDAVFVEMLQQVAPKDNASTENLTEAKHVSERCAATMIGKMIQLSPRLAKKMVRRGTTEALLQLLTMTDSTELVQEAGASLKALLEQVPQVKEMVTFVLGPKMYREFKTDILTMLRQLTAQDIAGFHRRLNSDQCSRPIFAGTNLNVGAGIEEENDVEVLTEGDKLLNAGLNSIGKSTRALERQHAGLKPTSITALTSAAQQDVRSTLYALPDSSIVPEFAQRAGNQLGAADKVTSEVEFQNHIKEVELSRQQRDNITMSERVDPSKVRIPVPVAEVDKPSMEFVKADVLKPKASLQSPREAREQEERERRLQQQQKEPKIVPKKEKAKTDVATRMQNRRLSDQLQGMRMSVGLTGPKGEISKGVDLIDLAIREEQGETMVDPTTWGNTLKSQKQLPSPRDTDTPRDVATRLASTDFNDDFD